VHDSLRRLGRHGIHIVVIGLVLGAALAFHTRAAQPSVPGVDYAIMEMMVKNALAALNHANLTGNYTVLRDLGTEKFRQRNSASDLANIFARFRSDRYDLSPILTVNPQYLQPPGEAEPGRLQLIGFFNTRPQIVQFAFVYERTASGWSLDEVAVGVSPADGAQAAPQPAH
jgi:hypothetical protein